MPLTPPTNSFSLKNNKNITLDVRNLTDILALGIYSLFSPGLSITRFWQVSRGVVGLDSELSGGQVDLWILK